MESASLLLWASSLGVVFGWQPMPDGSPSYEYIVQLEPELVATLEAGHSIPITSDIPAEVGPIGRIRIVVGRDELPRQQLVTQFKPLPKTFAGQPRDGIVETQFTAPAAGSGGVDRYGNPVSSSAAILPPSGNAPGATDAFARSLQQGAQQVINQGAQGIQNKINEILPAENNQRRNLGQAVQAEARELFGNTGNDPITPPGLSQEASILRAGNSRQPAIPGSIAPPFTNQNRQSPATGAILPPGDTGTRPTDNLTNPSRGPRLDQPITPGQPSNWSANDREQPIAGSPRNPSLRDTPASPRGDVNAPWPPVQQFDDPANASSNGAPTDPNYGVNTGNDFLTGNWPASGGSPRNDRFDIARQGQPSPDTTGLSPTGQSPPTQNTGTWNNNGQDGPQLSPARSAAMQNATWPPAPPTHATIRKGMLAGPADAPLEAADGQHLAAVPPPNYTQVGSNPATQQKVGYQQPPTHSPANNLMSGRSDSVFPLLLSWVLLSGSVAGNIYLFWNYFDMRGKYSSLVYDTGRRGGERHREYD